MREEMRAAASAGQSGKINSRRSGIRIMGQLIGLVKPLLPVMLLAIVLGTAGYLCAIFLTIFAGFGLVMQMELKTLFIALVVMAVMRGILHYG